MAYVKLIAFDRKLSGAVLPGSAATFFSETELLARDSAAFNRGIDSARALADQQMVDFRADIGQLGEGIFKRLASIEPELLAQLREALPALALDIARRLLAGYEPSAEVVSRLCEEALIELFPERDNLELAVSTRDADLLAKVQPDWLNRYPGLRIRGDSALKPGDCQVRSRFGLTDARLKTKLAALERNLTPG